VYPRVGVVVREGIRLGIKVGEQTEETSLGYIPGSWGIPF